MIAFRAFSSGVGSVLRAPLTVAAVLVITIAAAAPFALVMGERLQTSLNNQPPIILGSEEIDADWWFEFRRHAQGLAATFTPAIIGFAAPLSTLSAVLDGTPPATMMALPIAIALLTWAFLWGVAIDRFRTGGSRRGSALIAAGARTFPKFVTISIAATLAQLVIYLTMHPLLFKLVYPSVTASMVNERDAFIVRIVLYAIFGVLLITVSLAADYARIASAAGGGVGDGIAFVRRYWRSAVGLLLITVAILGACFVMYGIGEAYGGSRVAGWRGVVIGQLFIVLRLALRLVAIAAEVRLYELTRPGRS